MPSSAVYSLLEMAARSGPVEGWAFAVGRRTSWELELVIYDIEAGATVTIELQISPTGTAGSWAQALALGSFTSADNSTVSRWSTGKETPDFVVGSFDSYVRAEVTAADGVYHLELLGRGPFLRPTDQEETRALSQELREYDDGLVRIVELAESIVLDRGIGRDDSGRLEADLTHPVALDRIQDAIRAQAELEFQREQLRKARTSAEVTAAQDLPELDPSVLRLLGPILEDEGAIVWEGR